MTPSTATAVMVWRSIGAAMITLMEQRADHARRRDAPGQHSLCTTNDNVQCKRIAVKHLHDAAERYSTKAKQRHR